jgi:hypothetical protein
MEMVTTEASKAYITLHKIPTDFFLKPRSKTFPLTTSGALGREGSGGSIRRKVSGKLQPATLL